MLPKAYRFSNNLNLEKVFRTIPPPQINYSDLPILPDDWIETLARICCRENPNLPDTLFEKHLQGHYSLKSVLIEQLELIYDRLEGNLDKELGPLSEDNRCALLYKLTEDIDACTAGFHNRVNHIVTSFVKTELSLDNLLYSIRKNLVSDVASELNIKGEIHVWNHISVIANSNGLGITPNFQNDPYRGSLSDQSIRTALKEKFELNYTPFDIPVLIIFELYNLFETQGFVGVKKENESYTIEFTESVLERLEKCLPSLKTNISDESENHLKKYFIIDENDCIRTINWIQIHQDLIKELVSQNYLKKIPEPKNLINSYDLYKIASISSLHDYELSNREITWIFANLKNNNPELSVDELIYFQNETPIFFEKLNKNKGIKRSLESFIKKLIKQNNPLLASLETVSMLANIDLNPKLTNKLFIHLLKKNNIIHQVKANHKEFDCYFHDNENRVDFIAEFFIRLQGKLNKKIINKIFKQKYCLEHNILVAALKKNSGALGSIRILFDLLTSHKKLISNKIVRKLFGEKDYFGDNFYKVATKKDPEVIKITLDFMSQITISKKSKNLAQFIFTQLIWLNPEDEKNEARLSKLLTKNADLLLKKFSMKYYENNIPHLFYVTKKLLELYIEGLKERQEKHITHTTRFLFFKFGFSTKEKTAAVKALELTLNSFNNAARSSNLSMPLMLEELKQNHPALGNGRLAKLFSAIYKIIEKEQENDPVPPRMEQRTHLTLPI